MTVTYHDPCDLGRGARVFDAPREIIGSIPGRQDSWSSRAIVKTARAAGVAETWR